MSARRVMVDSCCLGIDTSNYTTSAALLRSGGVTQSKKLLPVKAGTLGLRQNEALFHHTRQLPEVLLPLLSGKIHAIGVSDRPRSVEGSYMPCFLSGVGTAEVLSAALSVPLHRFSHQEGHIAAALFSAGKLPLLEERFIAFHLSGGTSEGLLVERGKNGHPIIRILSETLDINAGQAIDRVGLMLGCSFPAGKELDTLAAGVKNSRPIKPAIKENNFSLSGVENKCRKLLEEGADKSEIAAFCLSYIVSTIEKITEKLVSEVGALPILFSGGVSSNSLLRAHMETRFGVYFAAPEFSADNAAGAAILAAYKEKWL